MPDKFHHERSYRGAEPLLRLASVPITLCGAGALGSLLADNLARQGFRQWKVIDRDRVEEHNVGTQLYGESEVGAWKVEALRGRLFRSVGIEIEAIAKELTDRNARSLLKGAGVVSTRSTIRPAGGSCRSGVARRISLACTWASTRTTPRSSGTRITGCPPTWPAMSATIRWPVTWCSWQSRWRRRP